MRDISASNFRFTSGPPKTSAGTIAELALQLEAARLGALLLNPDLPAKCEDEAHRFADLPARTGAECLLRSFVARSALDRGPIAVAGDLAEEVATHPGLVSQGGHPLWRTNITICLVEAERYDVADRMLSRAIHHAERLGSPQWLARALWLRGLARHRPATCAPRKQTVGLRSIFRD